MPWIIGGAAVLSGFMGSGAASDAASVQAASAQQAQNTQKAMFDTINGQQAPWRQAGVNALGALSKGFGMGPISAGYAPAPQQQTQPGNAGATPGGSWVNQSTREGDNQVWQPDAPSQQTFTPDAPVQQQTFTPDRTIGTMGAPGPDGGAGGIGSGQFTHQFGAGDLNASLAPNYKFMLDQGLGATNNQASVGGGLVGGNALKGINDYAQNYAQNGYQNAYANYNNNQTNIFNRLSNIAGLGQTANNNTGFAGMNIAGNIGSAQLAGGASQAAGIVGSNNALTGGLNNAAGSYYMNNLLSRGGSNGSSNFGNNAFGSLSPTGGFAQNFNFLGE